MRRLIAAMLLAALMPAAVLAREPAPVNATDTEAVDRQRVQTNLTDWVRVGPLVGVTGLVGFRASFLGFKWPSFYANFLEGGFLVHAGPSGNHQPAWPRCLLDGFVGMDFGWLWTRGPHYVSVGTLLQANLLYWYHDRPMDDALDVTLGVGVGPIARYRHYWGRFGLEVSVEMPVVLGWGGQHVATPWPLFGVSVGM